MAAANERKTYLLGQEQLTQEFNNNSIALNLQQQARSIYLLTIENEEGMLLKQVKLVKE